MQPALAQVYRNMSLIKTAVYLKGKGFKGAGGKYVDGWVYGSSALGLTFATPEVMGASLLGGGVLGGGTGALTYINTTPQKEFSYSKLGIYTGGGTVTGILAGMTKNPIYIFGTGTMRAYTI